jgi:YVTN family beta-propeller protein
MSRKVFRPIAFMLAILLLVLAPPIHAEMSLLAEIALNDPLNGREPWGIAVHPDDHRVFVACIHGPCELMVLDGEADTLLARAPLTGPYPHGIEVGPSGERVYVASSGGSVSIVDAATLAEIAVTPLAGTPMDLCSVQPPDGEETLYVVDVEGAQVWLLHALSGAQLGSIPVGNLPFDICWNPLTDRVYVANLSDDTVSVIDTASESVIATIPVGSYPEGIALDPGLDRIYTANREDDTISVIDGASGSVIAVHPVGDSPHKVAVDPLTHRIYVCNDSSNDVTILDPDGPTGETVGVGLVPRGGICVDPVLGRVFVANLSSDDVSAFSGHQPSNVATIRIRFTPGSVALARHVGDGGARWHSLIVANRRGNEILHLDVDGGAPLRTLLTGYAPGDADTRLGGDLVAATLADEDRLVLLDWDSGQPFDSIPVGPHPVAVCLREDRDIAYVANHEGETLAVVDVALGEVVDTIVLPGYALDVGVNESSNRIYVSTWWGLLCVLDGDSHEIIDTIGLSGWCEPNQLAIDEARNLVFVAALNCNVLWVVDGQNHEIIEAVMLSADDPGGVMVNDLLEHAYVCDGSRLVSIGPDFAIDDILELPGDLDHCAADRTNNRIYISGSDGGGGRIFTVLDGDPSAAGDDDCQDDVAAGPASWVSPIRLALDSPNPLRLAGGRGGAHVRLHLEVERGAAVLAILDVKGRLVRRLAGNGPGGAFGSGSHLVRWDCRAASGSAVIAGVYFALARGARAASSGTAAAVQRIVLVK